MVTDITAMRAIMDTMDIIVIMDMYRTVVQAFKDTTEIPENIIKAIEGTKGIAAIKAIMNIRES
jgi:hypothetical protein